MLNTFLHEVNFVTL